MPELNDELENEYDPLNTEENLFKTLADGSNDEYEDDDAIEEEKSFDEWEDDDNDNENEDDENVLFNTNEEDDDENEDDEDDSDLTEKDLEIFNKKLGTDFKNVDELKKSFNAKDEESESQKEEAEYKILSNKIVLFDKYIGMSNEDLIRNQMLSEASAAKKDIEDQEVIDEIEEKIEALKDLDTLDGYAETLRSNLQTQKDKTQTSIEKIENKKIESENAIARKNNDDLQNALADVYNQKEFMGVTVTREDLLDVYENIRTNKFFESVNGNQEMIAKLALFVKYEKEISKVAKQSTHSDKTKDAFNFLTDNSKKTRRSIASATGSASSGNAAENLSAWLK